MSFQLAELVGFGQSALIVGFFVFLRVGAAMALLPAFGERSVPERVRLFLGFAFTLIVAPASALQVETALSDPMRASAMVFSEPIAGLVLGGAVRLFILALQIAGSMAAQSTSLAQIFGGANSDPQPAIGHVLLVSGLALAVMLGLHVRLAELFILSYDVMPAGQFIAGDILSQWALDLVARIFGLAFTLAAPFLIASLIYNVALGVINRAMPQLMVAFVGAPAITAGGLILLFVCAPLLLPLWVDALVAFLDRPFGEP
ncbi:flagellar biosynthetic protein FliR [Aliiroseovarius crassostreae]|uniref:flagellar biosynthetic protein FliR n=1 Tax=Aliiroseovarius crassostreae TaxID=154981 RepID=UPI00220CBD92|nr:flagellar biosynthetic protein FliR [Aliiroseovarius crassostreae]UWQ01422.1 flagellar biosynthetic protein FliR [Aliiroseovarius crassostreae]